MKNMLFSILFAILIQLLIVSCGKPEDNPPITFDDNYVNKQILLRAPDFFNTFKTNDAIALEITYLGNDEIVFPNNYNLRIFSQSEKEWIEINETPTTRLPPGDVVLSPIKGQSVIQDFVMPDLKNLEKSYQLRIYVIGNMKTDDGTREVAAYADITLHP